MPSPTITTQVHLEYDFSESLQLLQESDSACINEDEMIEWAIEETLEAGVQSLRPESITVLIGPAADYLNSAGTACPFCACTDLHGGPFEADAAIVWQNITCGHCGSEWTDEFKLVGMNNVTHRPIEPLTPPNP